MLLVMLLLRCQQDCCCQQRHLRLHCVLTAALGVCRTAAQHQKQQKQQLRQLQGCCQTQT
jgi:hypothetical protein